MKFNQKCYQKLKEIPKGKVSTYKYLAKAINSQGYRAVGNAMSKNKNLIEVPCHRIVKSDGSIGKYVNGSLAKKELLINEGLTIKDNKIIDFEQKLYKFEK